MNAWKPLLFVLLLLAALPMPSEGAPNETPCKNPVKGTWAFGLAPKGCDLTTDSQTLLTRYGELTYRNTAEVPAAHERGRYMEGMHAFLRDAADYYLDQRRRRPSATERKEWRLFVMALTHQESFWSHYREEEEKQIKFMRGDSGHGYGISQVDDRWHKKFIRGGEAEDLATNLMYGMDMHFKNWEKAAKARCVPKGDYAKRARAAYAAYNGGPAKYCRWVNPKDAWARNDQGFWEKYRAKAWLKLVANTEARSPINVECLVEGGENCGPGVGTEPPSPPIPYFYPRVPELQAKAHPKFLPSRPQSREWMRG